VGVDLARGGGPLLVGEHVAHYPPLLGGVLGEVDGAPEHGGDVEVVALPLDVAVVDDGLPPDAWVGPHVVELLPLGGAVEV